MMTSDTKTCPRCAETVKAAALVCRYCRHEFEATPSSTASQPQRDAFARQWSPPPAAPSSGIGMKALKVIGLVIGIPVAAFMAFTVVFAISEAVSDTQYYAS